MTTTSPEPRPTDGLASLITNVLRKYGGTMKGRGDHDIFDALVRYRAALDPPVLTPAGLTADDIVRAAWRFLDPITSQDYVGEKVDVEADAIDAFRRVLRQWDDQRSGSPVPTPTTTSPEPPGLIAALKAVLPRHFVTRTVSDQHYAAIASDLLAALGSPVPTQEKT